MNKLTSTRRLRLVTPERFLFSIAMLLCIQAGCSSADGYTTPTTLVAVTGSVTLDGEPLQGATVSFIPTGGTSGTGGFSVTDDSGKFEALHYSQATGLEPGTYNVTFSRLVLPDGSPLPEGKDAADLGAVESLPPHLAQALPNKHPWKLTVQSTPEDVTFELESKVKRGR